MLFASELPRSLSRAFLPSLFLELRAVDHARAAKLPMLTSADGSTDGLLLVSVAAISTLLGVIIGTFITRRRQENVVVVSKLPREDSFISLESQRHVSTSTANTGKKDDAEINPARAEATDMEDSRRVLEGAIELFCRQWDVPTQKNAHNVPENEADTLQPQNGKVVEYLKPEEMLAKLFHNGDGDDCDLGRSLSLKRRRKRSDMNASENSLDTDSKAKTDDFLHLLSQIQRYSVNTSHPNFFNQLFGAMDPVALAAELLALSLNTSSYTYETAPVFTLLEREVMNRLGKLVFEGKDECDDDEDVDTEKSPKYDGLMIPGGSLSNLTALHIARHQWLVTNGYDAPIRARKDDVVDDVDQAESETFDDEEKKEDCAHLFRTNVGANPAQADSAERRVPPRMVALVSDEAHYSFRKAMAVTGIGASNLIAVRTLKNGQMDPDALDNVIRDAKGRGMAPFFVAATSGSTVRGSFDDIDAIVRVCRANETVDASSGHRNSIWVHVDGAWGGSAIFSRRSAIAKLLAGVQRADSFTFNPHKMLGAPNQTTAFITRHRGLLRASNSTGAKYLFDPRKNGADYDLGDSTFTCGRRPDAIRLWALWKYHGRDGLGERVEQNVDSLAVLAELIQRHDAFMLACEPWPFNVNFFYLPPRVRLALKERNISTDRRRSCSALPDEISKDLARVSVQLKLRLHEAGEMIIPFQPLNDQKADCFRLVLAGDKTLSRKDFIELLSTMDRYGRDL